MAAFKADLVVQDVDGDPIAVVEVKNPQDLSLDVATEMHRNMLARGLPKHVPYFLLLSQDKGYLWKRSDNENPDSPPSYEFPMDTVVKRYEKNPTHRLYNEVLEFLVLQWLIHLAENEQKGGDEPEQTLALSGFSDSIRGATVLFGKVG